MLAVPAVRDRQPIQGLPSVQAFGCGNFWMPETMNPPMHATARMSAEMVAVLRWPPARTRYCLPPMGIQRKHRGEAGDCGGGTERRAQRSRAGPGAKGLRMTTRTKDAPHAGHAGSRSCRSAGHIQPAGGAVPLSFTAAEGSPRESKKGQAGTAEGHKRAAEMVAERWVECCPSKIEALCLAAPTATWPQEPRTAE